MTLKFIEKRKEKREKCRELEELENRVAIFIEKVDSLKDDDPELACRFLKQATRIYHDRLGGYVPEIDPRFNEVFLDFAEEYLS